MCVCVCVKERKGARACVCVCVCKTERRGGGGGDREKHPVGFWGRGAHLIDQVAPVRVHLPEDCDERLLEVLVSRTLWKSKLVEVGALAQGSLKIDGLRDGPGVLRTPLSVQDRVVGPYERAPFSCDEVLDCHPNVPDDEVSTSMREAGTHQQENAQGYGTWSKGKANGNSGTLVSTRRSWDRCNLTAVWVPKDKSTRGSCHVQSKESWKVVLYQFR